jgi:hypothetical protein
MGVAADLKDEPANTVHPRSGIGLAADGDCLRGGVHVT